jgi:hypothetical protein
MLANGGAFLECVVLILLCLDPKQFQERRFQLATASNKVGRNRLSERGDQLQPLSVAG